MTALQATRTQTSADTPRSGRLFLLELSGDRIHSMNPDGSDRKTIVTNCQLPDGVVIDVEAGHICWTNMGVPSRGDGSIERADLDGRNRRVIVSQGATHTPKQIHNEPRGTSTVLPSRRDGRRDLDAEIWRATNDVPPAHAG
jgi:hypothetical protein